MNYTLKELKPLKTISQGQSCDLKIETETSRIWLSRCTIADGEPYDNKVTVEELIDGKWITTKQYKAE